MTFRTGLTKGDENGMQTPKKPSDNHSWKKTVRPEVVKWAYKESHVSETNNIYVARPTSLEGSKRSKERMV